MPEQDRYGLALSTSSAEAAAQYRDATDLLLSAWPGMEAGFTAAIAADADFALAHAGRARARMMAADMAGARADLALAEQLAARHGDGRERSHVAILSHMAAGAGAKALSATLEHLNDWPRDAVVFSLAMGAFGLLAFSGMADHDAARVALCARHAHHYGEDWWFQVVQGWARTEAGDPLGGGAETERGFAARPANANAMHALSHALFEQGAMDEAETRIAAFLPGYGRAGLLFSHISWHQALSLLERGDLAGALALHGARIAPPVSAAGPLNVLSDGAALLWRLHLAGYAVPPALWDEIVEYATPRFPPGGNAFGEWHMALLAAGTGNRAALAARIAAQEERLRAGTLPAGRVVPELGRALADFMDGHYAQAARRFAAIAPEAARFAGSHAQREVIEDTHLVALIRAGEAKAARDLLNARLHRRPAARDRRWMAGLG